jgi:hypothetical protein
VSKRLWAPSETSARDPDSKPATSFARDSAALAKTEARAALCLRHGSFWRSGEGSMVKLCVMAKEGTKQGLPHLDLAAMFRLVF